VRRACNAECPSKEMGRHPTYSNANWQEGMSPFS
jgi:hypothetical protein